MTRSLPHFNTIVQTLQGVCGIEMWKTPYISANLKLYQTCPNNWGKFIKSIKTCPKNWGKFNKFIIITDN